MSFGKKPNKTPPLLNRHLYIARLHRYKEDQEMYETCDIVIEMIDGGCWEIFSKNTDWIDQLALKYDYTEFLKSDFQKN